MCKFVAACLLTILFPAVITAWILSLNVRTHYGGITVIPPKRMFAAFMVPTIFAVRELRKKSLSLSGISAAIIVGFVMTISNTSFIVSMLVFFMTSSKLTKFRAAKKASQDDSQDVTRNWMNVLNNGGIPTGFALLYMLEIGCGDWPIDLNNPYLYTSSWLSVGVLGAIACACGDTWASEIGSAVGSPTAVLLTTGRTVPAGTNGGVTIWGTLASLCGGCLIGLTFALTSYVTTHASSFPWLLVFAGMNAGLCGSLLDSFIGATLQYSGYDEEKKKVVAKPGPDVKHISGIYLLGNHSVNLMSCFVSALWTPVCYVYLAGFLDEYN